MNWLEEGEQSDGEKTAKSEGESAIKRMECQVIFGFGSRYLLAGDASGRRLAIADTLIRVPRSTVEGGTCQPGGACWCRLQPGR